MEQPAAADDDNDGLDDGPDGPPPDDANDANDGDDANDSGDEAAPLIAETREIGDEHVGGATVPPLSEHPAAPEPPITSRRAGRNLPAAIAVGVLLGVLIVGSLFTYPPAFAVIVGAAVAASIWELRGAFATVGRHLPIVPLTAGSLAMLFFAWRDGGDGLVLALFLTVGLCMVWRLPGRRTYALRDSVAAAFSAIYVPFLAGFAVLMAVQSHGPQRVIIFIATVAAVDTGGYAAGVLAGRHKLAPRISPKKTWEGLGGSVTFCVLVGGSLVPWLLPGGRIWQGALLGVATVLSATIGDLGESAIKRDIGIKDMSHLLPGHGGVMDRLDSMLPTAPVAFLLLSLFVPG
ncbi:MAG: phosphatidate cytidylyltransferase [Frankiaceae bacterium]|nr:phosphatidate cytidylyltransferase [Frankiaceae bacterium]